MPARPAHILVISITSCAHVARLRRPLDERAIEGRSLLVFKRALSARQTHEAVRSVARGHAHPVDGSRPRSRAWRICLNGESGGARAGVPARLHAHVPACPPPPLVLTLFVALFRPSSARYLELQRPAGWCLRVLAYSFTWTANVSVLRAGYAACWRWTRSDSCSCLRCCVIGM